MFWQRNLVSEEMATWVQEGYALLIKVIGPARFLHEVRLVLPTREFFKARPGEDHATAITVFDEVRGHMGMLGQPCELVRRPGRIEQAAYDYNQLSAVAGTYQADGNSAVITYDPDQMKRPVCFISTMAHELAHYVLESELMDGASGLEAEAEHELMTDLCAIAHGFGVIQMRAARQAGWAGYLSNETRAYATALFCHLKGISLADVEPHLDAFLLKRFRLAVKQLEREAEAIRRLEKLAD